jgi:hypothetical protein
MGLYSLANFLGGAFGTALIGRFIELDTGHWNPFTYDSSYSNAFILLTLVSFISLVLILTVQVKKQPNVVSQR